MANVVTTQLLVDGPRNVVVKLEGILDTSDLSAAGAISTTASTFNTTAGSPVVTFTAASLVPTAGQYLTFADGTTTFVANTYVVSVDSATQITVSNNAKITNTNINNVITAVAGAIVVLDPAQLSYMWEGGLQKATKLRIDQINYNIEDLLSVNLFWEATANKRIDELTGRGKQDKMFKFGGLTNNAGAGVTGKIVATTQGWVASAVLSFTLVIECVKQ